MNIRLIAADMDGTLLNARHEISDYTRRVLSRAGASFVGDPAAAFANLARANVPAGRLA